MDDEYHFSSYKRECKGGGLVCSHCGKITNSFYDIVPLLTCWSCDKPMWSSNYHHYKEIKAQILHRRIKEDQKEFDKLIKGLNE